MFRRCAPCRLSHSRPDPRWSDWRESGTRMKHTLGNAPLKDSQRRHIDCSERLVLKRDQLLSSELSTTSSTHLGPGFPPMLEVNNRGLGFYNPITAHGGFNVSDNINPSNQVVHRTDRVSCLQIPEAAPQMMN